MRENLKVSRILHEAEAPTQRHERVAVEAAQGVVGGHAPRLVNVVDRGAPVAPRAAERNLARAAGVEEHAQLVAAREAAPVGTIAGMLPEMPENAHLITSQGRHQITAHSILPRRGDTHLDSSIRTYRTRARHRAGRETAA